MWIMCARLVDAFSSTAGPQGGHSLRRTCSAARAQVNKLKSRGFSCFSTGFGLLYIYNSYLQVSRLTKK
jgi:hypothetical protein